MTRNRLVARPPRTFLALTGVILTTIVSSGIANAFPAPTGHWASNTFQFRADAARLVNDLAAQGAPFANTTEARYWVTTAAATWRERSAANVTITYLGDSTVRCKAGDGMSTVSVDRCKRTPGTNDFTLENSNGTIACHPGESIITHLVLGVGNTISEVDICFVEDVPSDFNYVDNNAYWSTVADGLNGNKYDAVGLLAWNFGVALGLSLSTSSTPKVVMNNPPFAFSSTLLRYPLGDDIDALRSVYGTATSSRVSWSRRGTSGAWSTSTTLTYPQYPTTGADGAIGHPAYGNSGYVGLFATSLGSPGYVVLEKATYPMTTSSAWSGYYLNLTYFYATTGFTPALAVNTGTFSDAEWFASWAEKLTTSDTCTVLGGNKLWGANSAYAFLPGYYFVSTYASECTAQSPSVVYDEPSNKFLAFYVKRDFASTLHNDEIYFRSFDPVYTGTWSAPHALSVKTVGPVDAACKPGVCALTYLSADTRTPQSTMTVFVYDSSADQVTLLWSAAATYYSQLRPAVAYREVDDTFTYAEAFNAAASSYWDDFRGYVWTKSDYYFPFVDFNQPVGTYTDHQHAIMEGVDVSWQYALMVH